MAAVPRHTAGLLVLVAATAAAALAADPALPRLRVSDNGRFLVTAEGQPFFWLGDTAWHMFGKSAKDGRANQPSARLYFANRAAKGFTVIQSVIVRSPEGGSMANAYGFEPFENGDWARPRLGPGANDDYWDHVDWCLAEAKRQGLRVAALPCWLDSITDGNPMVRDPGVAYRYGHFLGARYGQQPHLIWVLGGDAWQNGRNVNTPSRLALVRAMAEGIADGANGVDRRDGQAEWHNTLMTFHPPGGGRSSAEWLHAEPWLDFNMIQTTTRFAFQNWETVARDYARRPPKPTFDAEVAYEGSLSLRKSEPQDRRIGPWDVRRAAYWGVFAGGCGHTYGHRSFIGWIRKGETYRFGAHIPWYESLDAPGAFQMGHLRRLMESLPDPLQRVPDQSLLAGEAGTGNEHVAVTRDARGRYALAYSAAGRPFTLKLDRLAGDTLRAVWFNPREGTHRPLGDVARRGTREFAPPTQGEGQDWILVLGDANRKLPLPVRLGEAPCVAREAGGRDSRPRVIIETDAGGDPDDEQSLVRFLVYANELDVEGIIANRPVARDRENQNRIRDGLGIVRAQVDAYGRCYANLVQHDPRFPKPEDLLARTVAGYDDTEDGVDLVLRAADRADPRPLWFCNWGTDRGSAASCLTRALDRVLRQRGRDGYAQFKSRLRLSSSDNFGAHTTTLEPPFPLWVDTFRPPLDGKRWYHRFSALTATAGGFDVQRDVRTGHGPLGALYPTNTGLPQKEGDTMAFLYLLPTGMNDPHEPTWGSWAGRYGPNAEHPGKPYFWANQKDAWRGTTSRDNTLARWAADLQNDFRARMDWCVKPRAGANHRPNAVLNGRGGGEVLRLEAKPGSMVELNARASSDPDGDAITAEWFVYGEAGTCAREIQLASTVGPTTRFTVPEMTRAETIHVILRLSDHGEPALCAYRRAVVTASP